ncbi:MAG: T9SS type A sorting domain-containing protein [Chlorobi bacterium]|nr:T9SS type A sorting domain-containing protein [Chlorobiota bacterium]
MIRKLFTLIIFLITSFILNAQSFAPPANFEGTTAIHKDSLVFIDWAKGAVVNRSYKDIAFPENGFVEYGKDTFAIGKADGNPNVVTLGDGGSAILTFNSPIVNGNGYDFAVFENGFFKNDTSELAFLELAFVEVSTDGIEYVRFPAISELQTETQIGGFENINARYIHNLAGKYTMYYGTPFDLEELTELVQGTSVNLNEINYVKIVDVIGTINDEFATFDSKENKVNDPYPTEFISGGFDLDAVGVINNQLNTEFENNILIKPNPAKDFISFQTKNIINEIKIYSIEGKLVISTNKSININIQNLQDGIYIVEVKDNKGKYFDKFVKK